MLIFIIFVSSTHDVNRDVHSYLLVIFQAKRVNMLRMGEVSKFDHQAMQHMLTSGAIDWYGFGKQIAHETNALLGGSDAVLIIDESACAKKGAASAGVARQCNGRLGKAGGYREIACKLSDNTGPHL